MAFFIFVLLLSVISFCVVILCYGLTLKFFHGSKVAQWIITPLAVVGWNFLVITRNGIARPILGALPIVAVAGMLLYAKFKYNEPAPTPMELARKQNGQSAKSHKAAPKHQKRDAAHNSKKSKK
ncbi:hypothetical protein [Acidaminococcus timonensis]|uniref:hypothetical protein n=1 Tax=Acidaminococcus timonensis TaxID=1871002 RepID=UPI002942EBFE|nr:hypothetical protein [Acidaminococcus timonensis]